MPSGWTVSGGASATVNNGVTIASTETYEDIGMYYSSISFGASIAEDVYSIGTSNPTAVIGFANGVTSDGHGGDNPDDGYTFMSSPNDGSNMGIGKWSSGSLTTLVALTPITSKYILTGEWYGSNLVFLYNYSLQKSISDSSYSQSSMSILIAGTKGANFVDEQDTYQWVRLRNAPPNGVMPSVSFGSVS